jgi:hypothetical protein
LDAALLNQLLPEQTTIVFMMLSESVDLRQ